MLAFEIIMSSEISQAKNDKNHIPCFFSYTKPRKKEEEEEKA
jgi:hypothetical protein